MSVYFLLRDGSEGPCKEIDLPEGMVLRTWRPRDDPALPLTPLDPLRAAVWLQDRCRMFADGRYTELSIWRSGRRIHRLIVTPSWHRFPFMQPGDLQLGALWTHPSWRRKGLARWTMNRAHRIFAAPSQWFWYVSDSGNAASTTLARAVGYRLVGEGRRTRPAGLALLGQFRIDQTCEV